MRPDHLTANTDSITSLRRRETIAERRERRAEVDDPEVVLDAAARFLEARSRSVHEVRRRLLDRGYRGELVEGAIARLLDYGVLDDEVFARTWVESRDRARPRGERAIREELRLKGVDRSVIDQVLGERREGVSQPPDADAEGSGNVDRDAALRLIAKHRRSLDRVVDLRQRRQRAYALLARNGFDPEVCREVSASVASPSDDDR